MTYVLNRKVPKEELRKAAVCQSCLQPVIRDDARCAVCQATYHESCLARTGCMELTCAEGERNRLKYTMRARTTDLEVEDGPHGFEDDDCPICAHHRMHHGMGQPRKPRDPGPRPSVYQPPVTVSPETLASFPVSPIDHSPRRRASSRRRENRFEWLVRPTACLALLASVAPLLDLILHPRKAYLVTEPFEILQFNLMMHILLALMGLAATAMVFTNNPAMQSVNIAYYLTSAGFVAMGLYWLEPHFFFVGIGVAVLSSLVLTFSKKPGSSRMD